MFYLQNIKVLKPSQRIISPFLVLCTCTGMVLCHYFFSHIRAPHVSPIGNTKLQVGNSFKIRSDDEKALTFDVCFPGSERDLCTKHMKDNLKQFLTQKEEIDEKSRKQIVSLKHFKDFIFYFCKIRAIIM